MLKFGTDCLPEHTVDKKLLDILVCPVSGAAVSLADTQTLARLNEAIEAGQARYADDSMVEQRVDAVLVTADGATAYRVDDDIPVMLPERGIALPAQAGARPGPVAARVTAQIPASSKSTARPGSTSIAARRHAGGVFIGKRAI